MPLDLAVVGQSTKPFSLTYDWRALATYALGIGAKRDELVHLYEGHEGGIRAYPTFAVIPALPPVMDLIGRSGGNAATVVHGAQRIHALRTLPPSGTLSTTGTATALYDMKKFGQLVIDTKTTLDGEEAFESSWSILFRGEGNFGGPRPPARDEPTIPKDREPDWTVEESTSPEQALLYRLSGDQNPLHADPGFAERVGFPQGPILHGLCTYGFVARAILRMAAGGDASKLRRFSAQFRKPVWPGDTIVTRGYRLSEDKVAVEASVKERPDDPVITGAWAEIG